MEGPKKKLGKLLKVREREREGEKKKNMKNIEIYSSCHNHGSGEWVPTRLVFSTIGSFSTSMIVGGRVSVLLAIN